MPRYRFFENSRHGARDAEAQNMDRRVVSTGRRERRRREYPARRQGLPLRLFSRIPIRRRAVGLLALVACATTSTLLRHAVRSSNVSVRVAEGRQQGPSSPNLGPNAIPSVVLVDRRRSVLSSHASGGVGSGEKLKELGPSPGSGSGEASDGLRGCGNTVQGMALLADSEGRVCRRDERDPQRPGCCAAHTLRQPQRQQEGGEGVVEVGARLPATHSGEAYDGGFPPEEALSTLFSCWSCDVGEGGSSCCRSYEFCVSCCQDPSRADEREAVRAAAARSGHPAYMDLGDNGDVESTGSLLLAGEERRRAARGSAFAYCAFRCRTHSGSVAHENSFRGPLKHCFGRFQPPAALESSPINRPGTQPNESLRGGDQAATHGVQEEGRAASPLRLDPIFAWFNKKLQT